MISAVIVVFFGDRRGHTAAGPQGDQPSVVLVQAGRADNDLIILGIRRDDRVIGAREAVGPEHHLIGPERRGHDERAAIRIHDAALQDRARDITYDDPVLPIAGPWQVCRLPSSDPSANRNPAGQSGCLPGSPGCTYRLAVRKQVDSRWWFPCQRF